MVSTDPLMEVRGARSSWLTIPRNSARILSSSFRDVISCRVTTHRLHLARRASNRDGVALTRTVTDRPSGTLRTISSGPHRVSPVLSSLGDGQNLDRYLRSVGPPVVSGTSSNLLRGLIRVHAGFSTIRTRLPVEGDRRSRPGVEDRHTHGRGVDQRLQARPRPLFVPVPAGVGDDQRRLGRRTAPASPRPRG